MVKNIDSHIFGVHVEVSRILTLIYLEEKRG